MHALSSASHRCSVPSPSELYEKGSLYRLIDDSHDEPPEYPARLRWAQETADGMAFLHGVGIAHRDLKSPNLLIDDVRNAIPLPRARSRPRPCQRSGSYSSMVQCGKYKNRVLVIRAVSTGHAHPNN